MKWTTLMVAGLAFGTWPSAQAAVDTGSPSLPAVRQKLAVLSVPFVPNAGQWDERAAFAAQTFAGTLFVTTDGRLVYRLPGKVDASPAGRGTAGDASGRSARTAGWVLTETLVDTSGTPVAAKPRGDGPKAGKVSYLIGNDERTQRGGLPAYERVDLGVVYPGIDVQVRAAGSNVEKIFTVEPRQDPAAIRVRISGATKLELGGDGQLIAHTGNGPVAYSAPIAYQEDAQGERAAVAVHYALDDAKGAYGFALGPYDAGRPLVIDPLIQSTYLGGDDQDRLTAMAIHPSTGDVYVAGYTYSTNFPKVTGGAQPHTASFYWDSYITRLNSALTTRLQSTYIGGTGSDYIKALAIHPVSGEIYVGGSTDSDDFPNVLGSDQPNGGIDTDAFISRLNPALTTILQSTFIGAGGAIDEVKAIAFDPASGEVYAAGVTYADGFPHVTGGAQATKGAGGDGFIAKLNSALTTHLQATYLGGNALDVIYGMAVHPATGDVYVAGMTQSTDFPNVAGSQQTTNAGGTQDAFVSRLNAGLTTNIQSTYLGGNGIDQGFGLAIHPFTGEIYVTGYTVSTDFPATAGSEQPSKAAQDDAFVTRLNRELTQRLQSTYLGGSVIEQANAIAIHPVTGHVYVAGYTSSSDLPLVANGAQSAISTGDDGFITQINSNLLTRIQSTFLGGNGNEEIMAIAIHPASGEIYVAGETTSTNFPGVAGSEQTTIGFVGLYDGFVSRLSRDLRSVDIYPDAFSFPPILGAPVGSLQVSAPALISGFSGSVNVALTGGNYAQYCISSAAGCACDVQPYTSASGPIVPGRYVCVRQLAPSVSPSVAKAQLAVGTGFGTFFVSTGNALSACSLDADGNGAQDALTDGLMIIRALFGLTGTSVTNGAMGTGATRADWASLRAYFNGNCGSTFQP